MAFNPWLFLKIPSLLQKLLLGEDGQVQSLVVEIPHGWFRKGDVPHIGAHQAWAELEVLKE